MNIKQAIEKFRNEDIAVNVQTEQEWIEFMELLEEHSDMRWGFDIKPTTNNQWSQSKSKTCIRNGSPLYFSSELYYKNKGQEIITFQEFKKLYQKENDMKRFKPSDFKQYMKVKYRNKGEQVIKEHHYNTIENYCESYDWKLNHMRHSAYDIMEVYEPTLDGWKLLWKREEPKYMLKFPKEMFSVDCKLIECFGTYDRAGIDFNPRTDIKVEFTQEEIDAIPFNTDTFVKIEVE